MLYIHPIGNEQPDSVSKGSKGMLTVEGTVILNSNLEVNNLDKCRSFSSLRPSAGTRGLSRRLLGYGLFNTIENETIYRKF